MSLELNSTSVFRIFGSAITYIAIGRITFVHISLERFAPSYTVYRLCNRYETVAHSIIRPAYTMHICLCF